MMQHPLANPYAHVHPFFWPVLWLSLRAFVRWTSAMIEAGHGFAGLSVELTWYGVIRVRALDLSKERAAFHRHMMGEPCEEGWDVLSEAAGRMDALLKSQNPPHSRAGGNPWVSRATGCAGRNDGPWVPACAGMSAELETAPKGTGPPLVQAPRKRALPHPCGGGFGAGRAEGYGSGGCWAACRRLSRASW